jgi:CelD/BcsL family acetyltransferase involved in cellulose biosynthesis
MICAPDVVIPWEPLLEAAGLSSFEFHALAGSQRDEFPQRTCDVSVRSFRCDIGGDPQAYLRRLSRNHKTVGRQPQKTRKLQREVGPVTFEFDCRDRELLLRTIEMKSRQYRRTHTLDLFSPRWTVRLLEELFVGSTDGNPVRSADGQQAGGRVRGVLSVLRAGERVVAAHYGLLEAGWLHYWFPVYDPQFAKYSPGTALFRFLLETAGEHGLTCIDMGYGEQPYKWKQTDASDSVLQGCVASSSFYRHYRSACRRFVATAKRVPGKEPLKRLWRSLWPDAGISKLR